MEKPLSILSLKNGMIKNSFLASNKEEPPSLLLENSPVLLVPEMPPSNISETGFKDAKDGLLLLSPLMEPNTEFLKDLYIHSQLHAAEMELIKWLKD